MLLPLNIRDCFPKDHICFVINDVVDNLDVSCLEKSYSANGCPAYNPKMLIKLLFYGYTQGTRSSRKLEKLAYENLVFRFLSANQTPDHGTINLFRKSHLLDLENLFAQIVLLCDGLGIINPKDISIDGSIFKANASKRNFLDQEAITKLKTKIGQMLAEAQKIDDEEDEKYGKGKRGDEIPEELLDPEVRQAKIKKLREKMEQLEKAEKDIENKQQEAKTSEDKKLLNNQKINLTDPDAKMMKMKNGLGCQPAYNGQISSSNQVIVAYNVVAENTDTNELIPMIEKTETITKQEVETVKADAGYFSKENMAGLEKKEIAAYIPDQAKSLEEYQEKNNQVPTYDRRNFSYDKDNDTFTCPQKQQLKFDRIKQGVKEYVGENCSRCPVQKQCTKGKNRYIHIDDQLEKYKKEGRQLLNSKEGKAKYIERMSEIEPIFGNLIRNQGAHHFLCRGKPMVKIEFGLSCIAHNLVKIANWMKNNKENIKNINLAALMRLRTAA